MTEREREATYRDRGLERERVCDRERERATYRDRELERERATEREREKPLTGNEGKRE